jgi:hypothetical protein
MWRIEMQRRQRAATRVVQWVLAVKVAEGGRAVAHVRTLGQQRLHPAIGASQCLCVSISPSVQVEQLPHRKAAAYGRQWVLGRDPKRQCTVHETLRAARHMSGAACRQTTSEKTHDPNAG